MSHKRLWAGLDAGMEQSRLAVIDDQLGLVLDTNVASDARAIAAALVGIGEAVIEDIALETGSQSIHLVHGLRAAGYQATLYPAGQVSRYLRMRRNKTDNNDARGLAELAKLKLPSMSGVHLKSPEIQRLRSKLQFRHKLTLQRVACEGMIRSLVALHGGRLKASQSAASIERNVHSELARLRDEKEVDLSSDLLPLLDLALGLRRYLAHLDYEFGQWARGHPVCSRFLEIPGVGTICAVSFYTAIENPDRFKKTSDVGPYLGLTPRILQSGESLRHGRISKMGSKLTRSHLVNAATVLFAGRIADHPLKRWGLKLAERAGRGKARVAVARRLAITMLAMWKSGSPYHAALATPRDYG